MPNPTPRLRPPFPRNADAVWPRSLLSLKLNASATRSDSHRPGGAIIHTPTPIGFFTPWPTPPPPCPVRRSRGRHSTSETRLHIRRIADANPTVPCYVFGTPSARPAPAQPRLHYLWSQDTPMQFCGTPTPGQLPTARRRISVSHPYAASDPAARVGYGDGSPEQSGGRAKLPGAPCSHPLHRNHLPRRSFCIPTLTPLMTQPDY